ncbi:hypothetical protein ACLI4Q_20250 [Natrialbaceae archaeon A-CW1-1]
MTSAHGFTVEGGSSACGVDIEGELAYQGDCDSSDSYPIGRVEYYDHGYDWALINKDEMPTGKSSSSSVVDEYPRIVGRVTENGVDELISNDETVYHYGMKTCSTEGTVKEYANYDRCENEDYIALTTDAASGDSGGPHYRYVQDPNGDYLELIGPHTRHLTVTDHFCHCEVHYESHAPAAFKIAENTNILFGGVNC